MQLRRISKKSRSIDIVGFSLRPKERKFHMETATNDDNNHTVLVESS